MVVSSLLHGSVHAAAKLGEMVVGRWLRDVDVWEMTAGREGGGRWSALGLGFCCCCSREVELAKEARREA
ncbi:hypothetical protein LXL04_038278 [Taraxacum kok-saghyz]